MRNQRGSITYLMRIVKRFGLDTCLRILELRDLSRKRNEGVNGRTIRGQSAFKNDGNEDRQAGCLLSLFMHLFK